MQRDEFLEKRNALLGELETAKNSLNLRYTALIKEYMEATTHVRKEQVLELVSGMKKKRGCTDRFVVYLMDVEVFGGEMPFLRISGWWLDENNVPKVWDTLTIDGVANPIVLKLSENQENKPHPDATK